MGQPSNDGNGDKRARTNAQKKPAKKHPGNFQRFDSALTWLCVDHWFFSALFILALGFLAIAIQSYFSRATPKQWLITALSVFAAYAFLAAGRAWLTRAPLEPNLLVAANDPDPKVAAIAALSDANSPQFEGMPPEFKQMIRKLPSLIPDHALKVFMGSTLGTTSSDEQTILRMAGADMLSIRRVNGKISICAKVFGRDNRIAAEIENNRFFVNEDNVFRIDTPDTHTLRVFDDQAELILEVRYLNPLSVRVLGVFRKINCPELRITDEKIAIDGRPWMTGCLVSSSQPGGTLINIG